MSVRQMPTALIATRTSPGAGDSGSGGACHACRRRDCLSCLSDHPGQLYGGKQWRGRWKSDVSPLAHLLKPQVIDPMKHRSIVVSAVGGAAAEVSKML